MEEDTSLWAAHSRDRLILCFGDCHWNCWLSDICSGRTGVTRPILDASDWTVAIGRQSSARGSAGPMRSPSTPSPTGCGGGMRTSSTSGTTVLASSISLCLFSVILYGIILKFYSWREVGNVWGVGNVNFELTTDNGERLIITNISRLRKWRNFGRSMITLQLISLQF